MKLSKYNFIRKYPDNIMIYNSRTGAIALLDNDFFSNDIISGDFNKNKMQDIGIEYRNIITTLESEGMIVDDEFDEFAEIKAIYEENIHNSPLKLLILPTENCNFRCPYCFLYEKSGSHMSEDTKINILKFIENQLKHYYKLKKKDRYLLINWFGGEPTLKASFIIDFMKKVALICEKYSVTVMSTIVTNGYLLSARMLEKMVAAGVTHFQVTLDGDAESHNRTRYLINKKGTFDVIYSNLLQIRDLDDKRFAIDIRCNFTKGNIDGMHRLLALFSSDFKDDKRFNIYFRPVADYETKSNEIEQMDDLLFGFKEGMRQQTLFFYESKKATSTESERRIVNPLPMPTRAWCNANCDNSFMIGPEGRVYPCDTLIGEEHVVGQLGDDGVIKLNEAGLKWKKSIFEADDGTCLSCKLLPLCYGGCVRSRLENGYACYWQEEDIFNAMDNYYLSVMQTRNNNGAKELCVV